MSCLVINWSSKSAIVVFGSKLESEFTCLMASLNAFHAWLLLLFDNNAKIKRHTVICILIVIIIYSHNLVTLLYS